jgi:hypothetical protein
MDMTAHRRVAGERVTRATQRLIERTVTLVDKKNIYHAS